MTYHIYIHYPYCLYKCEYCDFNSYAYDKKEIPQNRYQQALLKEIQTRKKLYENSGTSFFPNKTKITSIFFGGGTPSLMQPQHVKELLEALKNEFVFSDDIEITLESNPGTVTEEKFSAFHDAGINRVSLGVQSFQNQYLQNFGRIHTGQQALQAIQNAKVAGFERVSCDLIFGFPGQTREEWQEDLNTVLAQNLKHLSCYALTAEEGTLYTKKLKQGLLQEIDSECFAHMQELTYDVLAQHHLTAYEISNFAASGEESKHNLGYWHYQSYLGLGAGAHSQFFSTQTRLPYRNINHRAPELYMRKLNEEAAFFNEEEVSQKEAVQEFFMMGLRLKEGVKLQEVKNRFGYSLPKEFDRVIENHVKRNLLKFEGGHLYPTRKGFLFNNFLLLELFESLSGVDSPPC